MTDPRRRIEQALAENAERLARLEHDHDRLVAATEASNADDEHDPEGATIAFEREHTAALAARAREHLADIDAALARLDAGRYGTCVRCGAPVSPARLEARPAAATCIACASRR